MSGGHKTVPIQVWADVDEGIAPLVQYLNTIPGVRTHASCQGTIGEGGAEPYGPYVLASYQAEEAEMRLRNEFYCTEVFMSTVRVHPREGWNAPPKCSERVHVPPMTLRECMEDEEPNKPESAAANCQLCGQPMPKGEEMFKYHGYSGPCPK